ncbi:MAG: AAA domain-containing protein, partial [Alphaproteobacteria bacterium]|nr:AAA domain-containing protein [Alphaproteobacteria bacterium]
MYNLSPDKSKEILNIWHFVELLSPLSSEKIDDFNAKARELKNSKQEFIKIYKDSLFLLEATPYLDPKHQEAGHYWHAYLGHLNWTQAEHKIKENLSKNQSDDITKAPAKLNFSRQRTMPIAAFILTEDGFLHPNSFVISSAAWAFGKIMNGDYLNDPKSFFQFTKDVDTINYEITALLYDKSKDTQEDFDRDEDLHVEISKVKNIPINHENIQKITQFLIERLKIDQHCLIDIPDVCIKKFVPKPLQEEHVEKQSKKNKPQPPQLEMFNSFFLDEIQLVQRNLKTISKNSAIGKYLGFDADPLALDPLNYKFALNDLLSPKNATFARWPRASSTVLASLQEAALSSILKEFKDNQRQLFSVNGPPGTGKTTLLYDLIVNLYVERATSLAVFDKAEDAFGKNIQFTPENGKYNYNVRDINPILKGYEIIIASSNNNAVENISKELPLSSKIDPAFQEDIQFFDWLSNFQSQDPEIWGNFAAILGKAENRKKFVQKFWQGNHDVESQKESFYPRKDSMKSSFGMDDFLACLKGKDIKIPLSLHQKILDDQNVIENKNSEWQKTCEKFTEKHEEVQLVLNALDHFEKHHPLYIQKLESQIDEIKNSIEKPLQKTPIERLKIILDQKQKELKNHKRPKDYDHNVTLNILKKHGFDFERLENDFFGRKDHADFHIEKPFFSAIFEKLRIELFQEALNLHALFIKINANSFWNNLKIFTDYISGTLQDRLIKPELLKSAWYSFFMVVPVVSTTFHSYRQMFHRFADEELGWLIIDEAAQAQPQHALGSIYRSKNVVILGDPFQTEPVQLLGDVLINQFFEKSDLNPKEWSPCFVSAQNLADRTMNYQADYENQKVGFPLIVHRRCQDPMFSICNA